MEQVLTGGAMRWCDLASTVSVMVCLGGVARRGPDVGRVLMGACRVVAPSGIMVALTAVGPGKAYAFISPGDGMAEDGDGGF